MFENLLDQDVASAGRFGQAIEVAAGIGQPIGMIDAHTIHEPGVNPAEHLPVRLVEDPRHLDADTRQGRDGEEPPEVQFARFVPPEHELPVLLAENLPDRRGIARRRGGSRAFGEREDMIEVGGGPERGVRPSGGLDRDLTRLDDAVEITAENGNAHAPLAERPIDVEGVRVPRPLTPQEHVPPPRVLARLRDS